MLAPGSSHFAKGKKKKGMKSEGDECEPPRNHQDVYVWVVQPAGLLLREIKIYAHLVGYIMTGWAGIWSQEIWVALACPLRCQWLWVSPSLCPRFLIPSEMRGSVPLPPAAEKFLNYCCIFHVGVCCCWTSHPVCGLPETRLYLVPNSVLKNFHHHLGCTMIPV